ncbi:hypothetical protein LCGC14_3139230, partial [marine sediment metagenome]
VGLVDGSNGARDYVTQMMAERFCGVVSSRNSDIPREPDMIFSWRFRISPDLEKHVRRGAVLVCFDLGYFDENKYDNFSISINGIHGQSMGVDGILDLPPRRHPRIWSWRSAGEFIQIISPGWLHDPTLRAAASELPAGWVIDTTGQAIAAFNRPVKVRHHPKGLPPGMSKIPPLATTFDETYVSISYASNAAIQTILAGVPTVVQHPRCPAYEIASHTLALSHPPGREAWAHRLSYRQYGMLQESEQKAAQEYIERGYAQAKKKGPLLDPLGTYGIRREK